MIEGKVPRFVSAAEITRNFGLWQDRAGQAPLIVTHHGRPRVAMLAIDDYELLSQPVRPGSPSSQDGTALAMLLERIDGSFIAFDPQLRFARLNGAALVHCDRPSEALIGTALTEVFPVLEGSPALALLRRIASSGEAEAIDAPSLVRPGRFLRLRAFSWPDGVALLFRDITGEADVDHKRAERAALSLARAAHGRAGTARLSLRGTFERVESSFAVLAGFACDRLEGVRMTDLLALSARAGASDEVEAVLTRGETRAFASRLLVNGGGERPVRLALAPLRHGIAITGAMLILTAE